MRTLRAVQKTDEDVWIRISVLNMDGLESETWTALLELSEEIESMSTIEGGLRLEPSSTSMEVLVQLAESYPIDFAKAVANQLDQAVCACFGLMPVHTFIHQPPKLVM